jgi:signal transduction histidine kinase
MASASSKAPADLQSWRRLVVVGASVYLAWWFVVRAVLPDSYNPPISRLGVVGAFLLALAGSFVSSAVRRHFHLVFSACAWLLTAHYYYLLYGNRGDMPWAVGAYVVVVAVSACLPTRRGLFAYSMFTLALGAAVSLLQPALLRTIFLPGLVTMTLLSNLTLHSRLLLEQERAERVRADAARALAESGVELRDDFIAIASHELRTPLASLQLAVQGLVRALRRPGGVPTAQALEQSAQLCLRQTTRLARLVDGLLDASQIAAGRVTLQIEDMALLDVARDVAQSLAVEAARAGSTIEVEGDTSVRGEWDRTRVEQVVSNLLRNALTFGLGRPIRVTVARERDHGREEDMARLCVIDHGIGVAREEHARIFGRFERAVSARNYGGVGLGLYVVSQIAQAHAGSVSVESEPGKGATFTVLLPPRPPQA